jgi:capsule polysaccharide export protein KpsE/RkpR
MMLAMLYCVVRCTWMYMWAYVQQCVVQHTYARMCNCVSTPQMATTTERSARTIARLDETLAAHQAQLAAIGAQRSSEALATVARVEALARTVAEAEQAVAASDERTKDWVAGALKGMQVIRVKSFWVKCVMHVMVSTHEVARDVTARTRKLCTKSDQPVYTSL